MAGFSVYTGQVANEFVSENTVSLEECTTTTKIVMGLLQRTWLLDNYSSVYFGNWFNSPQLLNEMYQHKTLGAGTVRLNCWGLPKAVVQRKLKKAETVYRRKGHLLCLKWCDKCPVTMLSSIHHAVKAQVKTNYLGNPVIKLVMIHDCNNRINIQTICFQPMRHWSQLNGTGNWCCIWSIWLFLMHLFSTRNMAHKKCPIHHIKNTLLTILLPHLWENVTCLRKKPPTPICNTETRLNGKLFIKKFEQLPNSKRKAPAHRCKVCNFTHEQLVHYGYEQLTLPVKYSSYGCTICTNVMLCLTPCFEVFHSKVNYRKKGLDNRLNDIL